MRFKSERQRRAVFAMMGAVAIGAPVAGLLRRGALRRQAVPFAQEMKLKSGTARRLARKVAKIDPNLATANAKKGFRDKTVVAAAQEGVRKQLEEATASIQRLRGEASAARDAMSKLKQRSVRAVKIGVLTGAASGGAGVGIYVHDRKSRR